MLTDAQGVCVGTKLMQLSASPSSALSLRSLEMRGYFPLSPPEEGRDGSVLLPVEPDGFFFGIWGLADVPPRMQSFRLRAACSNLSAPTSSSLRVGALAATASAFL